jgi:integrase
MASDWRLALLDSGVSIATAKTHVGNAKSIFKEAEDRELIARSPFRHLKGGPTPTSNTRYVTGEEAARVAEACPGPQWRLLFGLARYAGLRSPSETHLLTWADVDWARNRLTVRSPKTEHHRGHEQRVVPIDPRLLVLLRDAFEAAAEGEERLIAEIGIHGGTNGRALKRFVQAAGVETWDHAFQTLRRSCEIEWAQHYPQYAVSKWIGHSITISGRHYANSIPDELYARATGASIAAEPVGSA